ncbi:MAG: hypothetical protein A3F67_10870 [Verrucomicrobia bacterium RIFCSPHIGHO2_12_FULL_41_10]|nr:MAG: hypothetical protein A3F67_10870 [Verrucomicrobia bacterium RIFCSPHIGHO2_12_FULL_41_10]
MCIAIYKPAGEIISREVLETCFDNNDDGAGFMFSENRKLILYKGFFDFSSFYSVYKEHENKSCVIHFRIKTHGKINEENCHPFTVTPALAFVHNGVISGYGNTEYNDTYMFNEHILKGLIKQGGKKLLFSGIIKELIEKAIGYSKLIFMDASGEVEIFNERLGEWHTGVWYSNTSHKPKVVNYHHKYGSEKFMNWATYEHIVPPAKSKPIVSSIEKYFIKKPDYEMDVWDEDWVKINNNCRGLLKGTIAFVEKVHGTGFCDLAFPDGSTIKQFPGRFLDHLDWETDEEVLLLENFE